MEIRDSSGLSRFKNGFIVDNFASLSTADTLHPDYRVSTDFEERSNETISLYNSGSFTIQHSITKCATNR